MKNSKSMKKISFFELLLLFLFLGSSCTSTSQPYESFDLKVKGGVNLDARYYSPQKEGPGILMLCQCDPTTDQNEYESLATKLVNKGYHVISFDYRGFGKSEGSRPSF